MDRRDCDNFVLTDLREANSPDLVKSRGYISCASVLYEDDMDICRLFLCKMGEMPGFYVGGLADGAIGIMNVIATRYTRFEDAPTVYPFFVRKVEKGGRFIEKCFMEQPAPDADHPVIIVDDVLTTGFSVAKAAAAVHREWGYKPTLAVVLVDNEMGGKEFLLKKHGIECRSIFTRKEILGE